MSNRIEIELLFESPQEALTALQKALKSSMNGLSYELQERKVNDSDYTLSGAGPIHPMLTAFCFESIIDPKIVLPVIHKWLGDIITKIPTKNPLRVMLTFYMGNETLFYLIDSIGNQAVFDNNNLSVDLLKKSQDWHSEIIFSNLVFQAEDFYENGQFIQAFKNYSLAYEIRKDSIIKNRIQKCQQKIGLNHNELSSSNLSIVVPGADVSEVKNKPLKKRNSLRAIIQNRKVRLVASCILGFLLMSGIAFFIYWRYELKKMASEGNAYFYKRKYIEAFPLLDAAKGLNDHVVWKNLAKMYTDGLGTNKNLGKAAECYKMAADDGDAQSQNNLGTMYEIGEGVGQNYATALFWFRKSAAQTNAFAYYNLGKMYERGNGVTKDVHEALNWYLKICDTKNSDLLLELYEKYNPDLYLLEGVLSWDINDQLQKKNDYEIAMKFLLRAAQLENSKAEWIMGRMNEEGVSIQKNLNIAIKWYKKSAEHENAAGQYSLAEMYETGNGLSVNLDEAFKWYWKSAHNNSDCRSSVQMSMYKLGFFYENGLSLPKDRRKAILWYNASSSYNNSESIAALKRLGEKIFPPPPQGFVVDLPE